MEEQEIYIIRETGKLFLREGIKKFTMDDIAQELSVSKKTLYKYVANKSMLVDRCVQHIFTQISQAIDRESGTAENAIEELFSVDEALVANLRTKSPLVQAELANYYPGTFSWMYQARKEMILRRTRNNLTKGIEEGLYRDNINVEIVSNLYFARCSYIMENVVGSVDEHPECMRENLEYHIRGIATEAGLKLFEKLLNSNTKE